ncbi:aspartate ammonia-lyase [Platysternon megacephalum]|uniref:Aspartate ammonia-lyase n=1 Tax=Platysternon megacephalum TaxID=55544 RepID=A0A4D9DLU4_9SAUR|nr:aspartate ammonia-lyase [Platysternon megacephalum]
MENSPKNQNCPVFPENGPENQEGPVFPQDGPENREGPVFPEDGPENREGPVFSENGPENREDPVFSEKANAAVSAPTGETSPVRPVDEEEKGEPSSSATLTSSATGSPGSVTVATGDKSLKIICKERNKLIKIIKSDPGSVLDESLAQSIITDEDYDNMNTISDTETKIRKLLIQIQRKGELTCQQFLDCLETMFPGTHQDLQHHQWGLNQESQSLRAPELGEKGGLNPELELDIQEAREPEETDISKVPAPAGIAASPRPVTEEPLGDADRATPLTEPTTGSRDSVTAATAEKALQMIRGQRNKLANLLQNDADNVLDELLCRSVITEQEYDGVNKGEDAGKKMRKLLVLIQQKGGLVCQQFLESLQSLFPDFQQHVQYSGQGRPKALQYIESKLEMEKYRSRKLKLRDVLEITPESVKNWTTQTTGDLPWHFLRKLMALNGMARSTSLEHRAPTDQTISMDKEELDIHEDFSFLSDTYTSDSLHPLDVLCAILLCSDSFLQQEILSKMSMCQFALPLLLPAINTPKCTLMLWAMRDIVRKWRPQSLAESRGFREESLVLTSMPTISFVRLGSCSFSKSQLLNEVLSPSQQHHDFFIHRDMESGNVPREIADGLVEISWYFPGGMGNSDLFPEPVAVTNLHGDIESHWLQFSFLTQVSSAVFIVTESISEREYALLSSLQGSATKYYFILNNQSARAKETLGFLKKLASVLELNNSHVLWKGVFIVTESISEREYALLSSLQGSATKYYFILNNQSARAKETLGFLKKLASVLELNNSHVLWKGGTTNKAQFVKVLQSKIAAIMNSSPKRVSIEAMAETARQLGIQVDEDNKKCQSASEYAKEITGQIKDVAKYKREKLRLQGETWKNLAEVEKELCRMRNQGDTPLEKYKSQLKKKLMDLRAQQNKHDLTDGLTTFITGIRLLPPMEKHYFLKWMKFGLDHIARENLSKLRDQYKEKCKNSKDDPKMFAELDKLISASSLGMEHFMRELGQFYEAEHAMVKEGKIAESQRQFVHLPGIAADLMLEGFPIELIDGDVSNIPLQWVTDVLSQLHAKLKGRSRMLVLTVLGVQSTGKSTLLNTMFGLQFAVSSGRCTRGAFMLLIKVAENFWQELGCDFILVIDTEGLKAPELAKLEDSYQHDNELATLVIGLSDITIVNMAMENATEMKDVLQIVVHAFLRM